MGELGEVAVQRGEILGNEVDGNGGELVESTEDDVQPVNSLATPYTPTQSERDDHDLTHAQYRSWCEHCVKGRGVEMGHSAGDHAERGIAIVGFDYMFLTSSEVYTRAEWEESPETEVESDPSRVLKIVVVRDSKSKSIFAHAVRCKVKR